MKKSLLAYFLAAGLTAGSAQAAEPFPIQFIALGGGTQAVPSAEDDYERPFGAAVVNSASDNSACACVPEYRKARQLCVPTYYAEASGLLMHRAGTSYDRFLVADTDTDAGLVETGDLQSDLTGGFQVLLGWQLFGSPHTAVEVSYFGLYDWDNSVSLSDPGNDLVIPGFEALPVLTPTPNFDNASQVDLRYSSDLYNFEANLIRSLYAGGGKIDFLTGFRYVHLDESLGIVSNNPSFVAPGVGTYDLDAQNNLYGHQIGARFSRPVYRWSLQTVGKAGVFLNDASSSQSLSDATLLGPVAAANEFDRRSVAALGEIGIYGRRQLTDHWALKVGYQATGIGGVALASEQQTINVTNVLDDDADRPGGVRTDGFFFMHGGVFGLEAAW